MVYVILDLDETLIDQNVCRREECNHIHFSGLEKVHTRPHLNAFIYGLRSMNLNIAIFSWSSRERIVKIATLLGLRIKDEEIFSEEDVMFCNENSSYTKSVSIVKERLKEEVLLAIDDDVENYIDKASFNKVLYVSKWHATNDKDNELMRVLNEIRAMV